MVSSKTVYKYWRCFRLQKSIILLLVVAQCIFSDNSVLNADECRNELPLSFMKWFIQENDSSNYDIQPYISYHNGTVIVNDISISFEEICADPHTLYTTIKCECVSSGVQLHEWSGFESEYRDLLTELTKNDSSEHRFVSIRPEKPYSEQATERLIDCNRLYIISGSTQPFDVIMNSNIGETTKINQTFLVDILIYSEGVWNREICTIEKNIAVLPILDKFEIDQPMVFPDYSLNLEYFYMYSTPISVELIKHVNYIGDESQYFRLIFRSNSIIQPGAMLPQTLYFEIIDERTKEVVYSEGLTKRESHK